jgi:hypothetical protein
MPGIVNMTASKSHEALVTIFVASEQSIMLLGRHDAALVDELSTRRLL